MVLKELKEKLETSINPIAKPLHQGTGFKILAIGFKNGMLLKEHKAHTHSKLTVLEGSVYYKEENRVIKLDQYDEVTIPIDVIHSVEALDDSLCLLTQGE